MRPRSKSVSAATAAACEDSSDEESDAELTPFQKKYEETDASASKAWTAEDSLTLLQSITAMIPSKINEPYEETLKNINWEEIVFKKYTVDDLKLEFDRQLLLARKFRLLNEILDERQKEILPSLGVEKPVPAFVLFIRDHKDEITRKLPKDPKKGNFTAVASALFQNCDAALKAEYKESAKKLKAAYKQATTLYTVPKKRIKIKRKSTSTKTPKKAQIPVNLYIQSKRLQNPSAKVPALRREYTDLPKNKKLSWILRWLALRKGEKANLEQYQKCKNHLTKQELEIFDEYEGRPRLMNAYWLFSKDQMINKSSANSSRDSRKNFAEEWRNLSEEEKDVYRAEAKKKKDMFMGAMIRFVSSLPDDRRDEEIAALSKNSESTPKKRPVTKPTSVSMQHVGPEISEEEEEEVDSDADERIFEWDTKTVMQTPLVPPLKNKKNQSDKVPTLTPKNMRQQEHVTHNASPFLKIKESNFENDGHVKNSKDKGVEKSPVKRNQTNLDDNNVTDDSDVHQSSDDEPNASVMSPLKPSVSKSGGFQKIKDPDRSAGTDENQVLVGRKQVSPRKDKNKKAGTLPSAEKKSLNTSSFKKITDETFAEPEACSSVRKRRSSVELHLQSSKKKKLHSKGAEFSDIANDEIDEPNISPKKQSKKTSKTKDNEMPSSDYSFNFSDNDSDNEENDSANANQRLKELLMTKPPDTFAEYFAKQYSDGSVALESKDQKLWMKKYEKAKKKYAKEVKAFMKTLSPQQAAKLGRLMT